MMALHTNKDSAHIMHLIRKNTIGAEIGVWMGNTSTQFLKKGLKKFYMVDPYSVEPYKNSSEMTYQEWLAKYQPITGEIAEAGFQKFYERVTLNYYFNNKDNTRPDFIEPLPKK